MTNNSGGSGYGVCTRSSRCPHVAASSSTDALMPPPPQSIASVNPTPSPCPTPPRSIPPPPHLSPTGGGRPDRQRAAGGRRTARAGVGLWRVVVAIAARTLPDPAHRSPSPHDHPHRRAVAAGDEGPRRSRQPANPARLSAHCEVRDAQPGAWAGVGRAARRPRPNGRAIGSGPHERHADRQGPRRRARRPGPVRPAWTWWSRPATWSGWSGSTAPESRRCCVRSPGCSAAEERQRRAQPAHGRASATCRRSRDRRAGETVARLPGPPDRGRRRAGARWTRPTEALTEGRPGADDAYAGGAGALARARRRRPGGARRAGRRRAGAGRRPGPADDGALRRPGGPGRAGLAAAQPVRRLPARRADQRPRPGRPGPAGAVRHRAAGRHRAGQPRPRVPGPYGDPGARARPRPAADPHYGGGYARLPGGARGGPPARPRRASRSTPTPAVRAGGPGPDPAGLDGEGRQERPPQGPGQRQDRPEVPRPRRPRSRRPRPGRPSG